LGDIGMRHYWRPIDEARGHCHTSESRAQPDPCLCGASKPRHPAASPSRFPWPPLRRRCEQDNPSRTREKTRFRADSRIRWLAQVSILAAPVHRRSVGCRLKLGDRRNSSASGNRDDILLPMARDLRRWADTVVVFDAAAFGSLWYYSREEDSHTDNTGAESSDQPLPSLSVVADALDSE